MEPQRIYVGGLTAEIKKDDLIGRFKPFGAVHACDIVRGKTLTGNPAHCRGFAYVSFTPMDQAALARVFSLYNGCKWRGLKLRVELAKPDYRAKLHQEWQEELEQQQEAEHANQSAEGAAPAVDTAAGKEGEQVDATLRITMPGKRKSVLVDLTAKAKSHRSWFPTHKEKRLADLSWEPLQPSKRMALQAAAEEAAAAKPAVAGSSLQEPEQPARGVAVPHHYKEPQQPKQQQATKGLKAQLDRERWSQVKLIKRIAQQEAALALQQQQQLHQQAHRSSRAAATTAGAASAAAAAAGPQPVRLQQQAVPAGVVVMSDDEGEAAAGPAGVDAATLAQQLSKFDSDSEGEAPAAAAGGRGLWVPNGQASQQRQQHLHGSTASPHEGHRISTGANEEEEDGQDTEQQQTEQQLHSSSDGEEDKLDQLSPYHGGAGQQLGGSQGRDVQGEGMRQRHPGSTTAVAKAQQCEPTANTLKQRWKQQQLRQQQAASLHGNKGVDITASITEDSDSKERSHSDADEQEEQQQQQQLPRAQRPLRVSSAAAVAIHSGQPAAAKRVQPQQLPLAAAAQQRLQQPLAIVNFLNADGEGAEAAAAAALAMFDSDSEEMIVDVDDDDFEPAGRAKAQQQPQRRTRTASNSRLGDELLCPVAPKAGTGRAAVLGATWQQQHKRHKGSVDRRGDW